MTKKQILALQTWAVLTIAAVRREKITYGNLCVGLGYDPKVRAGNRTSPPLAVVQNFCLNTGKRHLTSIVVSTNGKPGVGFAKPHNKTVAECQKEVFSYGKLWFKHHQAFRKWVVENC